MNETRFLCTEPTSTAHISSYCQPLDAQNTLARMLKGRRAPHTPHIGSVYVLLCDYRRRRRLCGGSVCVCVCETMWGSHQTPNRVTWDIIFDVLCYTRPYSYTHIIAVRSCRRRLCLASSARLGVVCAVQKYAINLYGGIHTREYQLHFAAVDLVFLSVCVRARARSRAFSVYAGAHVRLCVSGFYASTHGCCDCVCSRAHWRQNSSGALAGWLAHTMSKPPPLSSPTLWWKVSEWMVRTWRTECSGKRFVARERACVFTAHIHGQ